MKRAIITGGAQGIGSAIALRFARERYETHVLEFDAEAIEDFRAEHPESGIIFHQCDVADDVPLSAAISSALGRDGALHALVNNAAIAVNKPLTELSRAEWDRVLAVNLTAPFMTAKLCAPALRAAKGAIVNIASTRALMSEAGTEAYSATKGGIVALTHALAVSFSPDVRVNAVSPGWIEVSHLQKQSRRKEIVHTEADRAQHPVGRVGTADDIASMVFYLASDDAGFITGQNFVVDGGMTKKMIYV
ncbi:MAG TPA: SDR family oxidoreductase [Spirochaetota bacterium]|nr:SDR family oxidoreductase [Spirochaetota bacterium]